MRLKSWLYTVLHAGCLALLLLQGSRIQKLRETIVADRALQMEWRKAAASDATEYTATIVAGFRST